MTVYVHQPVDFGKRIGNAGPWWVHMMADTPEELHAFARRVWPRVPARVVLSWCSDKTQKQSGPDLHYDVSARDPEKLPPPGGGRTPWDRAVQLGARQLTGSEFAELLRARRQAAKAAKAEQP